jgi:hypothetical protein
MTPCEWASCIDGYKLREEDAWQRTRLIYALIYNTNVDRQHQLKPEELIPLPSDKKMQELNTSVRYLTNEERNELKKRYKLG